MCLIACFSIKLLTILFRNDTNFYMNVVYRGLENPLTVSIGGLLPLQTACLFLFAKPTSVLTSFNLNSLILPFMAPII